MLSKQTKKNGDKKMMVRMLRQKEMSKILTSVIAPLAPLLFKSSLFLLLPVPSTYSL